MAGLDIVAAKMPDRTLRKAFKSVRNDIRALLLEMNEGDPDAAASHLEQITAFEARDGKQVAGKKNVKYLSEAQARVTYGKVKAAHAEWK